MTRLSVVVFDTVELEPSYLGLYFDSLLHWNAEGVAQTQFIVVSQRKDVSVTEDICKRVPESVVCRVHAPRQDWVNGYPVWDILASLREVWPEVRGRYVTFNHPEYIWSPNRLERTIDWLYRERLYFVLGNLRRPGRYKDIAAQHTADHCIREASDRLHNTMMKGDWKLAASVCETLPTCWWMFWTGVEQHPGRVPYIEDAFLLDKEWLDSWEFVRHGGELPFQDVYDLIGNAVRSTLFKYNVQPRYCYRMPLDANRIIHLWHPKVWGSWRPEIRDWFLSNPDRWKGTKFLDPTIWNQLIEIRAKMPKTYQPVNTLRNAPGGTVTRYGLALSEWLRAGGHEQVNRFYARYGREKRK